MLLNIEKWNVKLFNTLTYNKKLGSPKGESYIYGIIIKIKVMIKELIQAIKQDPITALTDFLSILAIMGFGYVMILIASILEGNV